MQRLNRTAVKRTALSLALAAICTVLQAGNAADLIFDETALNQVPNVDLIPALARLIVRAAEESQVIVVSHANSLIEALADAGAQKLSLFKEFGETHIEGANSPKFVWPKR